MKRSTMPTVLLVLGLGVLLSAAGCQSPGPAAAQEQGVMCPACKAETRTLPAKDLAYSRSICPSCRTVGAANPNLEAYAGAGAGAVVHVCDHCQARVEKCAACRKQAAN